MDKHRNLSICLIALEILNESSDNSSKEEDIIEELVSPIEIRPRIKNYMGTVKEYSDKEFKSHFRMSRVVFTYLLNLIKLRKTIILLVSTSNNSILLHDAIL
ncbi:hypothetical protein ACFW04_007447 [Cataglyphis niger]